MTDMDELTGGDGSYADVQWAQGATVDLAVDRVPRVLCQAGGVGRSQKDCACRVGVCVLMPTASGTGRRRVTGDQIPA
jgi:hypothetical protein